MRNPWLAEARATLVLAWPIVLTNLAQMALTTTDTVMVGALSAEALAAVTLGGNLYWAMFPLVFGVATAAAPMLSQAWGRRGLRGGAGRGVVRDMRRTVRQAFWGCVLAVLPAWLLLWHAGALLGAMGQDPMLVALAQDYARALMWSLLPFGWFAVLRGFTAALEQPGPALAVAIAAILFNALANWLLIFGNWGFPAMGVAGAGWASTLSNLMMAAGLAALVRADRRMGRFRLAGRFWRADWPRFRELFRLGLPITATQLFETGVFTVSALLIGLISAVALAAHAVALQTAGLTFMVPLGLAQAATARVGLATGAGDPAAARRAGWTAIGLGIVFMTASAVVMLVLPQTIAGLYLKADDPVSRQAVALAGTLLVLAGLFQVFDGLQATGAGALRGLKDTSVPMVIAGIGYWVIGLPTGALLAFGLGFGAPGLWIGLILGLAVVALLMAARWRVLSDRFHRARAR